MKPARYLFKSIALIMLVVYCTFNSSAQDNRGNPLPHFLFPSFSNGLVLLKDGQKLTTLLNYNMVDEKMVTEVEGVYRYSKNPHLIDSIIVEGRLFIPVNNTFYELISNDPVRIYVQHKSYLTPKGNNVGYGASSQSVGKTQMKRYELTNVVYQYGEVVNIDLPQNVDVTPATVYWVSKNGDLEKFTTQKQFLKIFPEYETQLKEFIKKDKINMNRREDLARLGKYCGELVNGKK